MDFLTVWTFALIFAYLLFCAILFVVSTARFIRRRDNGRVPEKGETVRQVFGIAVSVCSFAGFIVVVGTPGLF